MSTEHCYELCQVHEQVLWQDKIAFISPTGNKFVKTTNKKWTEIGDESDEVFWLLQVLNLRLYNLNFLLCVCENSLLSFVPVITVGANCVLIGSNFLSFGSFCHFIYSLIYIACFNWYLLLMRASQEH